MHLPFFRAFGAILGPFLVSHMSYHVYHMPQVLHVYILVHILHVLCVMWFTVYV